jgi:hypothetical protein
MLPTAANGYPGIFANFWLCRLNPDLRRSRIWTSRTVVSTTAIIATYGDIENSSIKRAAMTLIEGRSRGQTSNGPFGVRILGTSLSLRSR